MSDDRNDGERLEDINPEELEQALSEGEGSGAYRQDQLGTEGSEEETRGSRRLGYNPLLEDPPEEESEGGDAEDTPAQVQSDESGEPGQRQTESRDTPAEQKIRELDFGGRKINLDQVAPEDLEGLHSDFQNQLREVTRVRQQNHVMAEELQRQKTSGKTDNPQAREELREQREEIDSTILEIDSTILEIEKLMEEDESSLQSKMFGAEGVKDGFVVPVANSFRTLNKRNEELAKLVEEQNAKIEQLGESVKPVKERYEQESRSSAFQQEAMSLEKHYGEPFRKAVPTMARLLEDPQSPVATKVEDGHMSLEELYYIARGHMAENGEPTGSGSSSAPQKVTADNLTEYLTDEELATVQEKMARQYLEKNRRERQSQPPTPMGNEPSGAGTTTPADKPKTLREARDMHLRQLRREEEGQGR